MAYTFLNLATMSTVSVPDEEWSRHLAAARAGGWEEEGTRYDLPCQVDEVYDAMYDYLYNLLLIFQVTRELFEWDGNYDEKKNQIVSERDARRLMEALETTWASDDRGLLQFLGNGAFRILGE